VQKIIKDCTSLHGRLLQVKRTNPTGNPSEDDLMRVAVGLLNKAVRISDMYDVIKNKAYNVGKQFVFMNCYEVLRDRFPTRLQPTSLATTMSGIERGGLPQVHNEEDATDVRARDADEHGSGGPAGAPRSRPQGSKSAKRARRLQSAGDSFSEEISGVSIALSSYTAAFKSVSEQSLAQGADASQAKRLRAGAASLRAGLDAYKTIFAEDAGASAADRDQYLGLLRQEAIQQAQSAIHAPATLQQTGLQAQQSRTSRTSSSSDGHDLAGSSTIND
jgi:hypothetical protein